LELTAGEDRKEGKDRRSGGSGEGNGVDGDLFGARFFRETPGKRMEIISILKERALNVQEGGGRGKLRATDKAHRGRTLEDLGKGALQLGV